MDMERAGASRSRTSPNIHYSALGFFYYSLEIGPGMIIGQHGSRILNEEVAYKRGVGRPEMKFIYAKSKHGGTSLVHNHSVRRACMAPRPY